MFASDVLPTLRCETESRKAPLTPEPPTHASRVAARGGAEQAAVSGVDDVTGASFYEQLSDAAGR